MLLNLQYFRGIAAVLVVLAHANLFIDKELMYGIFIPGWSGVDFFFVLSGFIIQYVHNKDVGEKACLIPYLKKRFIRVFPVYWVYTILALLVNTVLIFLFGKGIISWIDIDMVNILKSLLLFPTDVKINEMPILPPAWTLTYEILFYAFFAIAIFFKRVVSNVILILWLLLIALNGLGMLDLNHSPATYTILNTKVGEFFIGSLIAWFLLNYKNKLSKNHFYLMLWAGVALVWLSWINIAFDFYLFSKVDDLFSFGLPYGLIILGGVGLDMHSSLESKKTKGIMKNILLLLGNASYSIYLIHFIVIISFKGAVIMFVDNYSNYAFEMFIFISFLSIILGCIAYYIIEKPIIKYTNHLFLR
jgi:peptidoglycan/LPS O-acetylase OafA/YrhL